MNWPNRSFNVGGWGNPWNVGEDDGQLGQGPGGKAGGISAMQRQFAGPLNQGNFQMGPQQQFQMKQQAPPVPTFDSPQQAAQWCAAYPGHPQCAMVMQQLAQILDQGVGMRMAVDGKFSQEMFYKSMPTKTRMEQLPLSPLSLGAGLSGTMSVVVQKPFKGTKLSMFGDTGSFVISSITAAGQTVTAASGLIPAGRYALVDSWPNIAFPALTAGATIAITATNSSAVAAVLSAVIDGETGEA